MPSERKRGERGVVPSSEPRNQIKHVIGPEGGPHGEIGAGGPEGMKMAEAQP